MTRLPARRHGKAMVRLGNLRRPLALFALTFGAGVLLRPELGPAALVGAACPVCLVLAAKSRAPLPWAAGAGLLGGLLAWPPAPPPAPPAAAPLPRLVRLVGSLQPGSWQRERNEASFLLDLPEGRVRVRWREPWGELHGGDRVSLFGLARAEAPARRDGPGWWLSCRGRSLSRLAHAPWWHLPAWVDRARQAVAGRFQATLDPPARAPALCLLLGEGAELEPWAVLRFRRTGTAHLLVVSGLHVGLVAWLALRLTGGRRLWPALLAVPAYALLAGGRPPALRAMVGFLLWVAAPRLGRRRDLATVLAAAALPVLLAAPAEAAGPSLQISYAAVAAMGLWAGGWARAWRRLGCPGPVARTLGLGAAATAGTAPLLLYHFGSFSPWSLLLTPLLTPVLAGSVLLAGLALAAPELAGPALAWLLEAQVRLLELADRLPATPLHASAWPAPPLVLAGALLAGAALQGWGPRRLRAGSPLLLCLPFWSHAGGIEGPQARLLEVGHGQCLALKIPGLGVAVHDAGTLGSPQRLVRALAETLGEWGHPRVDFLVVSHPDLDHVSALPWLLGRLPVAQALLPDHPAAAVLALRLAACGVPTRLLPQGCRQEFRAGPARLTLLVPGVGARDPNQSSLVLHLAAPGLTLLSPGDLEGPPLGVLVRLGGTLPARILVAPHHGKATGREEELARAFGLRQVLVSRSWAAGEPPAAAAYGRQGAAIRWTAREGDLAAGPRREGED